MIVFPRHLVDQVRTRFERLYGSDRTPLLLERLGALAGRFGLDIAWRNERRPTRWDEGDSILITYGDMVRAEGEKPLQTLNRFATRFLKDAVRGIHILPFFPSSSDDGFSVIDYRVVDEALGEWGDVEAIGEHFDLMFDLVLNHVSSQSTWFRHFQTGIAPERHYFFFMEPEVDLSAVVRPRTSPLLTLTQTPCGERYVWTTFSADQVDLDFSNPDVLFEFLEILLSYATHGARIIRLDAIAYLWKEVGTPCINLPQTHEVVKLLRDVLEGLSPRTLLLTETNLPHDQNVSYFGDGDEAHMVYQFSLPPLLLHALQTGNSSYLTTWARDLDDPPPGCTFLNFTASHDGIGVRPLEGIVPDEELFDLVERVEKLGGRVSSRTGNDGRARPYELNITWFDAMGDPMIQDEATQIARFLCSQAIALALRGIPGIYFHSLTAGRNDYSGVQQTGHPRAINRGRWSEVQLNDLLSDRTSVTSRVYREYRRLLVLRAAYPAFHPDVPQRVLDLDNGLFGIERLATDGSERVISVHNLTNAAREIDICGLNSDGGAVPNEYQWIDIVADEIVDGADGSLALAPYQTRWLWPAVPGETPNPKHRDPIMSEVKTSQNADDESVRPWGRYDVLLDADDHKVKEITVLPGKRLSLQRHRRRSEHWHVVSGTAVVTRGDEALTLGPGESVDIPKQALHRIMNPGQGPLVFIEVQRGDYFGEDDIERFEDDYGRS
jgi:sucrose phosphorylase